ncbi:MAG: DUF3732 domain-containing protein [Chloroflexi bacterium]|nr:DUF3732 domain-containing protein [Chloroflexota bacterium]
MSFQVLEIVLYGHNGETRSVRLRPGRLNIITGSSKTGKTALISIMDYCLGATECAIPEGVIRESVAWVALRLDVEDGQALVARRLPKPGAQGATAVYYDIGVNLALPALNDLGQTTNLEALESLLGTHAGISMNIHEPPAGQTRRALIAGIRHALFYCFQQQTEVINNHYLFHKQSEEFVPSAIRDTLPYFLGAVDEDHAHKLRELREKRRALRALERKLAEFEAIRGRGLSKAQALLSEATDVGLGRSLEAVESWDAAVEALRAVSRDALPDEEEEIVVEGDEFERLQGERRRLSDDVIRLRDQLRAAEALAEDRDGFSEEGGAQLLRLRSIDLLDNKGGSDDHFCPLCRSPLREADLPPTIHEIQRSMADLDSQMRGIEERSPMMQGVIDSLSSRVGDLQNQLRENREALDAIQASNARLQAIEDRRARRSHVLGRVGLYLESLPELEDSSSLRREMDVLKDEILVLEKELSPELVESRVDSIMSILSRDMSRWAQEFRLEHSGHPFRLDPKRLTVVADSTSAPIPMDRMGSGANWVGCHIIAHLALHKWFAGQARPVPRFLFIDQPSQAYFPEDSDWQGDSFAQGGEDREAVARIYKLAISELDASDGEFQIIVTDHANFNEPWFQNCIVERWREGQKLVPDGWPTRQR